LNNTIPHSVCLVDPMFSWSETSLLETGLKSVLEWPGNFWGGIHSDLLGQKWTFSPKNTLANFYILLSTNDIVWGDILL
jgi:hypothetical protein